MKKTTILLYMGGIMLALCSCGKVTRLDGFALGTVYSVTVKGNAPADLQQQLDSLYAATEASMSVFDPASRLSRLNRNETDILDNNIEYCIELAERVSEMSGGKYDITILPLVEAYGFSGGRWHSDVNVDSLLQLVGYNKISIHDGRLVKEHPGTRIDLNSIAKGHIVDLTAAMLEDNGIRNYLVNIGGEVLSRGTKPRGKPWVIGIETPVEGNYVQGSSIQRRLSATGRGIATSGNYRNFTIGPDGRKYTHIIDPVTGLCTGSSLLSATVVAETCALADALGTMFIALGLEGSQELLIAHPELAVLLIWSDANGNMRTLVSNEMTPYLID